MRSVLFVSTANNADDSAALSSIPNILIPARKYNKEHGISGVLGVQDGHYVQLLQGPDREVAMLLNRIRLDHRHRDVCVLVEASEETTSYFQEYSLKLSSPKSNNDALIAFMDQHRAVIEAKVPSATVRKVLREFGFENQSTDKSEVTRHQEIRLAHWPDFEAIEPTPRNLDACALLVKGWASLDTLETRVFGGQASAVRDFVEQMKGLSILQERDVAHPPAAAATDNDSGEFFFSKMRTFIKGQLSGLLR